MPSEEPYQDLTWQLSPLVILWGHVVTGPAWLSSARVVRCTVKSGNERNPHPMLQVSWETAPVKRGGRSG